MRVGKGSIKGVPESVYKLVVAETADYERKKKALEKGDLSREQMIEYSRKVTLIDTAIQSVCFGEGRKAQCALIADIATMRGYETGAAREFYTTKGIYMRRKREAVMIISKLLGLL